MCGFDARRGRVVLLMRTRLKVYAEMLFDGVQARGLHAQQVFEMIKPLEEMVRWFLPRGVVFGHKVSVMFLSVNCLRRAASSDCRTDQPNRHHQSSDENRRAVTDWMSLLPIEIWGDTS